MSSYLDDRSERFAQALARGLPKRQAALRAGYSELTAEKAAYRLARKPVVLARLRELQGRLGDVGRIEHARDLARHAPAESVAAAPLLTEPDLPQIREPTRDLALATVEETESLRPRVSAMSVPETRAWLLDLLGEVAMDARSMRDRRSAITAASEIAKLNGLHTHRVEVATSVLDGLSAHELRGLQAALAAYDAGEAVIEVQAEEVLDGGAAVG